MFYSGSTGRNSRSYLMCTTARQLIRFSLPLRLLRSRDSPRHLTCIGADREGQGEGLGERGRKCALASLAGPRRAVRSTHSLDRNEDSTSSPSWLPCWNRSALGGP